MRPRMNDTRRPRAVSGEIMTDDAPSADEWSRVHRTEPDIVDAEYEVLDREPSTSGDVRSEGKMDPEAAVAGLDMLRPRAERGKSRRGEPGGPLFWTTGALLVVTAFWMSGGHALLDRTDFFKSRTPAAAIRVASVESRIEKQGARSLLFVDGEAVNDDGVARTLPTLSINVLDNDGRTTRYLLGTNDRRLLPGEHFTFSSRLIAPNSGVRSVSVTLREQDD